MIHHATNHDYRRDPAAGRTAVAVKTLKRLDASSHLLDLKPIAPRPVRPAPVRSPGWKRLLDQRIHLREMDRRTVSLHPRGWRDFPPKHAKTMGQAVAITVRRFFREHPLADLTVLTILHLVAVSVWHIVSWPVRAVAGIGKRKARHGIQGLPVFPLIGLAAETDEEYFDDGLEFLNDVAETEPAPPLNSGVFGFRVSALGLALAALVFALPFGAYSALAAVRDSRLDVVSSSTEAIYMLKAAGQAVQSVDFNSAADAFTGAQGLFQDASDRLGVVGRALAVIAAQLPMISGPAASAAPALSAGQEFAAGGAELANGIKSIEGAADPVAAVENLRDHLNSAMPHLARAEKSLLEIRPDAVPEEYRPLVEEAQARVPSLAGYLDKAQTLAAILPNLMGADLRRRYLVIFQNDAELRPTGGFMGSFALVDVDRGKVKNIEIPGGGTYDLQGQQKLKVVSPQPLHLVNPEWQFQDTNWSPDFPTAARTMVKFYEKAGGPTVDGVIALNTPVIEKLLAIVGPVELPEYGKTIDYRNFFFETQKAVELDYDKAENTPKKFIADLAPKILAKIMAADRGEWLKIAAMLDTAFAARQAQAWFSDVQAETAMARLGWDGGMNVPADGGDFLAVVHANIAGQKTDRVMSDEINHEAKILADGSAIVTLTVTRHHDGVPGALFTGVRNVDYLRVLVPKGSVLIEAKGFTPPDPKLFKIPAADYGEDPDLSEVEDSIRTDRASGTRISEELGLTVFGNWLQTDPGQSSTATVVYQLPPEAVATYVPSQEGFQGLINQVMRQERQMRYRLTVRKQAGADRTTFTSNLDIPRGYAMTAGAPRAEDDRGRLTATRSLDIDITLDSLLTMP